MTPCLPFRVGSVCGPYDPEIVFRELIAALHLHIVSGELGFARERQVPFVVLSRVAGAVVRATRQHSPTRSVPSIQNLIHAVCPSMSAPRNRWHRPQVTCSVAVRYKRWAPAP